MALMKIRKNYQLTIPRNLRSKFHLAEGDYVEMDGQDEFIVLRPVKIIQPNQEYFYTKEWQKGEAEVDEQIRKGEGYGPFETAEEALKSLKTEKNMKLAYSRKFLKEYRRLPASIQKTADKQLALLLSDFYHPSLSTKKMQDPRNIWEGRITKGYRFTFQTHEDFYFLRRIGTHDLLRRP